MKTNEANVDRILRIVIGLALFAFGAFGPFTGVLQIGAFVLGAIALATGASGFCPLYRLFGVSTCSVPNAKKA